MIADPHQLTARRLGIDTHAEAVVFLRKDSVICRSEGFTSHNRILLISATRRVIATLYQVEGDLLHRNEAGFSDSTWQLLELKEGDIIRAEHAAPVESLSQVRRRIFGQRLDEAGIHQIIRDVVAGRYSAIEITAFITACAAQPLNREEITSLTRAMVSNGERLSWNRAVVADKHSVGGLPGNRTTPIIVAICAALGLTIPKTSSRAITSPAGTADVMETLTSVALDETAMRRAVERENGCIAWGGAVALSPADDILIRIERALDIDSEGQMIASILSKKIAAGITHLVVDMPVGPTAKVRNPEAAAALEKGLMDVAGVFGMQLKVVHGDGSQPIGRGIGPALEARDVLAVLRCDPDAPQDLRERALTLAGALLELAEKTPAGQGRTEAARVLDDGRAWTKFQRICEAQGGMRVPPQASHHESLTASHAGTVIEIDNRRIARLAKLAGAPEDRAAGVELHVHVGQRVAAGTPLCTVHAEAEGGLTYALTYAAANADLFRLVAS